MATPNPITSQVADAATTVKSATVNVAEAAGQFVEGITPSLSTSTKIEGSQPIALLSVYDKTGLLEFAKGLADSGVRLLGSGGTAKKIREAGIAIECAGFFANSS